MNVSAIVLAAGSARRFGAPKMLAELNGAPVVRWSTLAATRSIATEVLVVAGEEASAIGTAIEGLPARLIVNDQHAGGMSTSLAHALDAIHPDADGALILLGDQPGVSVDVVNAIIARFDAGGSRIVQPCYRREPGHPVLFARALFAEMRAIRGDRGAREVLRRHAAEIALIAVDALAPRDVDVPEDLAAAWPLVPRNPPM